MTPARDAAGAGEQSKKPCKREDTCAPGFLLNGDPDRAVCVHQKEKGSWGILA